MTLDNISIFLSIFSLVIALLVLYFNFFHRRKPVFLCPEVMYINSRPMYKNTFPRPYLYIPLAIQNKGAKMIIVNRIFIELIRDEVKIPFKWFYMTDKFEISKELFEDVNQLAIPFRIEKYGFISKLIGFWTKYFIMGLIEEPSEYKINIQIIYNVKKKINLFWKIKLDETDLKILKESMESENETIGVGVNEIHQKKSKTKKLFFKS